MKVYFAKQKAKGNVYIVLKRSYRQEGKVYSKHIYSFGREDKALEHMKWLFENPNSFPEKLQNLGFDFFDLNQWIFDYESKYLTK
ncbi:hypothetical protein GFV16_00080 [Bacillus megaterium]|uniref:hypothetical protein n=1 Tax=Priestia megaterium TaxID=1404 RepID=UPI001293E822|nr:hypothetical protein [Priestia megaterium]MQR84341.1 hypothetical protein [Priestia megaterium]